MKTKKWFLLLVLFIYSLNGCVKDNKDNGEDDLTFTGTWEGILELQDNDTFSFILNVIVTGARLEGEFIFLNSSGVEFPFPLNSSSMISGDKVFINFDELDDFGEPTYKFRLKGTVNSSHDAVDGTFLLNDVSNPNYIWYAYKN